ncbi:MAG: NADP-dependent oxidoreductase [Dysgonamonadaceae bacterium]|nr:NADP-dependent oxidoreductase [Dysgonamonadaceae bacterium]MDD4246480.1 NADP-dependent oxidoreductase [Dysgonamonadaceae bacterium]
MNKTIILKSRPKGTPQLSDFEFVDEKMPEVMQGELLLKTIFVSVDPYLRGRMSDADSYVPPFELNKPISSGIVAEVVESKNENFKKGDFVSDRLEWKEYQISTGEGLQKIDPSIQPLSLYLGVIGMTGMTAYMGLTQIGKPKAGETIVVSGAAGAVGSTVGQIGKILGCRVVGIAGTDEKTEILKSKFGFDEAINYNTTKDMKKAIADASPQGVDIYYDNVGGSISDAVHRNLNQFGRIVVCGAISMYNATEMPMGPRVEGFLIKKSALMQGFIVSDFSDKFSEGAKQLGQWLKEGKLTYEETVVEGFDSIPQAFIDLFTGKNKGKMIVKV